MTRQDAEAIAISALTFLASDPERLGRFLSITGLGPGTLREAAGEPWFFGQILGYLAEDEALLVAFAADLGRAPDWIAGAHRLLAGPPAEGLDP